MKKQTNLVDTIVNSKEKDAEVVIVGAAYEKTASSRKGTANGPKAIIDLLDSKLELFDRKLKREVAKDLKIAYKNLGNLEKLTPEGALGKIKTECKKLVDSDKFVFLLGGEHSVSYGLFQALDGKINPKDTTILQIDAHCDLRNDDSDYTAHNPSKLAHSCVLRRASELGYPIVQVGIRTYSIGEYEYFSNPKNKVTTFEWGNGKKIPTIAEILKSIKTKNIYITIDVDGFDPAYMPGTGTPVQGGLEWWYGMELIEKAIETKNLVACDIVEVSPMRDSVLTEYGAAQLCYTMIARQFQKKRKK